LVHNFARRRHFDSVISRLAERGHDVCIAAVSEREQIRLGPVSHPGITAAPCPNLRADGWRDLVTALRMARDFSRYYHPRYANARLLRARAAKYMQRVFYDYWAFTEQRPWLTKRSWLLEWAFKGIEELIPSDRAFEAFIKDRRPDVILVTPLIRFGSYQTDYVKAAHKLGIPVGFVPYSWDNLSNKGLIRIHADRTLVWNEIQKREAVELHGAPHDTVVVTGAPRFDEFFAMKASTTREEFCAAAGLDPARPFVLYLCSSRFVARKENRFVTRFWLKALRQSPDPVLKSCGVLIRPHPAYPHRLLRAAGWLEQHAENVAVSPTDKSNADQGLYDSLYHAAAVVGLNTSAMIEAGIVGKSVLSILVPGFGGQEGTLHFDYLLQANGGLLSLDRSFEEHLRSLSMALANPEAGRERSLRFVGGFVRPYGLDVPATPIMVRKIEELAEVRKRPRRTPLWHYPARWALRRWSTRRVPAVADEDTETDDKEKALEGARRKKTKVSEKGARKDKLLPALPVLNGSATTHEVASAAVAGEREGPPGN
jgi:hypothetical protein